MTTEQQAMTDGPNTHHYRTFTQGTSFYPITIHYPNGDQHTFHVPAEVLNDIESHTPERERCPSCDHIEDEHRTPGGECIHAHCSCDQSWELVRDAV